jgi:2-dehydro-3-deoxygluconokinase
VRIAVIGEGMLELSRDPAAVGGWQLGHGGDTLNTAIHLARMRFDVGFITALGSDSFSERLRKEWQAEGLDVSHILTDPDRLPGLYAIETDAGGERSFAYWRKDSAARRMFRLNGADTAMDAVANAELLYFSLISLAILPEEDRQQLYGLCERARARGGRVAFDSNYRANLWSDPDEARSAADTAAGLADIGLPTLSDEEMLCGSASPQAVASRWHRLGVKEVAVKLGENGCFISRADGDQLHVPAATGVSVRDTSGAGDAFNAGYLGARLRGEPIETAAHAGHTLAGWVVGRAGAIPQADPDAPYGR